MDPKDQIKAKIDIVPFIQEYIPLKQAGRNFKALCPFHGEKSPSFVVSPERQIWHCFGCQKGGDCFTFLMEFEKMDFVEALKTLAKRAGVQLTDLRPSQDEQQRQRLLEINHLASEFYHYLLASHAIGKRARDYLEGRGIHKKTIETFKLGFAPHKWDALLTYLIKKKGFAEADIEKAGLIIKGQRFHDRFRGRIMFTLKDHRGNIVGFAGRIIDASTQEQARLPAPERSDGGQAKYINSPETPLYHKGELFYGLDITKEMIKKENQAIIVEGEFDMLQSFQAGVSNVVALKGTALTEMQVKLIKRFTQYIVLAFDVDIAGEGAARRSIELADKEGLSVKVVQGLDEKDPDETIRKNPLLWKKAVRDSSSVYDFLIDSAMRRFDPKTADGKRNISDEVLPAITAITNEIVKAHFIKRVARELDSGEEVIMRQLEKVEKQNQLPTKLSRPLPKEKASRQTLLEEHIIALLLQKGNADLFAQVAFFVLPDIFLSPSLRKIFEKLGAFYQGTSAAFAISAFVADLPKELVPTVDRLYLLDSEGIKDEYVFIEIEKAYRQLRLLALRERMQTLAALLKSASDDEKTGRLKEEFTSLSVQLAALTRQKSKQASL